MVEAAWADLAGEIACWRDSGMTIEFWWRDDDASIPDPALRRLFDLAERSQVPLALAAIPALAESAAFEAMPAQVSLLQHGVDHRNRAAVGGKKSEFAEGEPVDAAMARLAAGRAHLETVAGARVLPVLAPPWNRIHAALEARLCEAGYAGISTFGVRNVTNPPSGLKQVNTHVDIIDWKGGRGFVGEESALLQATRHLVAKRTGAADALEPTGWLTHHAVHDSASWEFLERLFEWTAGIAGVHWRSPARVFGHMEQSG